MRVVKRAMGIPTGYFWGKAQPRGAQRSGAQSRAAAVGPTDTRTFPLRLDGLTRSASMAAFLLLVGGVMPELVA